MDITHLSLNNITLPKRTFEHLFTEFNANTDVMEQSSLTLLDISDCSLTDTDLQPLVKYIKRDLPSLSSLILNHNKIRESGCTALAELLTV